MREFFLNYVIKNKLLIAFLVILFLWLLLKLSGVISAFFIAYILMASLSPFVNFLEKNRFPRIIAILIPYLLIITVFIFLIVPFYSIFTNQLFDAIKKGPSYIQIFSNSLAFRIRAQDVNSLIQIAVSNVERNLFDVTKNVLSTAVIFFVVIVLNIYLLFYRFELTKAILELFPKKQRSQAAETLLEINQKFGSWFRGQVILSISIGVLSWIALTIIGIPYALPLSIFAGILEVIPTIGPLISAIPAVLIAFSISPATAGLVVIAYIVIQQLENHILVPQVMKQAVNLNPIIVILAVLSGSELFGIIGAFLSIPFVSFIVVLAKEIKKIK